MNSLKRLLLGFVLPPFISTALLGLGIFFDKLNEIISSTDSAMWFITAMLYFWVFGFFFSLIPSLIYSLLMEFIVLRYVHSGVGVVGLSAGFGMLSGLAIGNIFPSFVMFLILGALTGLIVGYVLLRHYRTHKAKMDNQLG